MTERILVHYLNQFYAGLGGEEKANLPPQVVDGPVGPGKLLDGVLGNAGTIVATVVCGDNFINEEPERAADAISEALGRLGPDAVIAGPAFNAGRYGLACGYACTIAQAQGLPAVTAMHPENPGVIEHRRQVYILPAGETPSTMADVAQRLGSFALRLANGEPIGSADVEGFLPRGIRKAAIAAEPTYKRAVDMLAAKVRGEPFETEIPILVPDHVAPANPLGDTRGATIAMITTGGLIPRGNPERQVQGNPERYYRYPIEGLNQMVSTDWEAFHGGYYNITASENPNYILPLLPMRALEDQGVVGNIHPWIWTMPGVGTPVAKAKKFGAQIAEELVGSGVDGCILVAT